MTGTHLSENKVINQFLKYLLILRQNLIKDYYKSKRKSTKFINNSCNKEIYIILTSFTMIFTNSLVPLPTFKRKNTKTKQLLKSFLENILSMVTMQFLPGFKKLKNSSIILKSLMNNRLSLKRLYLI
jgi:hypothetical protein